MPHNVQYRPKLKTRAFEEWLTNKIKLQTADCTHGNPKVTISLKFPDALTK